MNYGGTPRFLYLQLNRHCNLRCTHCTFWQMEERPGLSPENVYDLVTEFATLNPSGTVVTCGGEPTMVPEKFWTMCARARELGLRVFSVMNGTGVKTAADARRMMVEGPHEVSISLDGPTAELHDRLRGAPGNFRVACKALSLLSAARDEHGLTDSRVHVMTIVGESLRGRLDEFYALCKRLGADKLKLNVVQPTFGGPQGDGHVDPFFQAEHLRDVEGLIREIEATDAKWGIRRNPRFLDALRSYAGGVVLERARGSLRWSTVRAESLDNICNSGERNVMVDDTRTMRLCWSGAFPGVQWRLPGDLTRFWRDDSDAWRGSLRTCKRLCGISHSVRKESATLPAES